MKTLLIALLVALPYWGIGQKKVELQPKKSVGKVVLKGQQDYTYHALSEKSTTLYSLTGPGKLYLNLRVRLTDGTFKSDDFRIKYVRSDEFIETFSVPSLLAGNLKFKSKSLAGSPSKLHRLVIDVPPGKHTYKIYKYRTNQKVHVRSFYEKHPTPKWLDMAPEVALNKKEVRFVKSKTTKSYYSISKQAVFRFTIADTASLRVIIRPEFTYSMLEETILRVRLQNLTTGEVTVYKVNSSKSNQVEFVTDSKKTPGTSSTFYLNLKKPLTPSCQYALSLAGGSKAAIIRVSQNTNPIQ